MASLTALFLAPFPPRRAQELLHLLPSPESKKPSLGFASARTGKRGGGIVRVWEAKVEDNAFVVGDKPDLEAEIYDFMQKSSKPSHFPTKGELIAAGRSDLAAAVVAEGGWLAFGWDLDEEEEERSKEFDGGYDHEDGRLRQDRFEIGCGHPDYPEASSSGRPMEMEGGEDGGIEGILSRLEKERNSSYGLELNGRRENERVPQINWDFDPGDLAAEIVPSDDRKISEQGILNDVSMDNKIHRLTTGAVGNRNGEKESYSDGKQIRGRLQHLESDLTSALHLLRSRVNSVISDKGEVNSMNELHRFSDAWEFQETEVMKARDKLRSIRANLTVLEGKMALEIIEAQKMMEEKQKKLEAAQKVLRDLRTACIIWPNTASEVLLAGSFDGWTSQRRMERSREGVFSLLLKLYPGRYEIKFIVDGTWKIDPLRPIVNNNGHENNLLVVS
ncbi:protein FLOURY ENDOSPERM 6, chloroplastic isoform X2 [Typha angustifolia]|uniref:protein FLOURY ENDOSPERM 6, chloroplastic isoform X2 n=1 Tax=Typha angustifolia TaxID=59011 RepID=UPI003C2F20DB